MRKECSQQILQNRCENLTKSNYYTPMLTETAYATLKIDSILKVRVTQSSEVLYVEIKLNNTMEDSGKERGCDKIVTLEGTVKK